MTGRLGEYNDEWILLHRIREKRRSPSLPSPKIMPIPDYQTLMLPVLLSVQDGEEYSLRSIIEDLAEQFNLSNNERKELLPSGKQPIFDNRVGWARTYLKKSGLVVYTRRGYFRITSLGKKILAQKPARIDNKFLRQFPSFLEFQSGGEIKEIKSTQPIADDEQQTPEEILEEGFQKIIKDLSLEVLDQIKACSPNFFEFLVVDLLLAIGYGGSRKEAGEVVGQSGDGGIDGIIKEDRLGLDVIYIQAKRWEGTVGRPEIQKFVGALQGKQARKGIFLTTSSFSKEAVEYVQIIDSKVILIDGQMLAKLMIENDVGMRTTQTYAIKEIDSDYFTE